MVKEFGVGVTLFDPPDARFLFEKTFFCFAEEEEGVKSLLLLDFQSLISWLLVESPLDQ